MKFKILVLVMLGMAFTIGMLGCEAENPGEPTPNQAPNTYISEASPGNVTTIAFYGTDTDGFVEAFDYKWDTDDDWTSTTDNSATFTDVFETESDMKVFYVKAIDNNGEEDPVPAEITLTPSNTLPETEITGGPEFGKSSGEDVIFSFAGEDLDPGGEVMKFEYTLDDLENWRETPVEYPHADYRGLASGGHVFYVRSVDNLGGKDATPAQVAFVVESGKHAPTIMNNSAVKDGGGWFSGAGTTFTFDVIVAEYYGNLPENYISFGYNDNTNYDQSRNPLTTGWGPNATYTVADADMLPGESTLYVKARDTEGNISLTAVSFTVAAFNPTEGILLIDDLNYVPDGYDDEADLDDKIKNGFMNGYSFTVRPETAPPAGPDDLAPYSTVILYSDNGYNNQYNGDLFAAYASAGGNLMITGYNLVDMAPTFAVYGMYPAVFGYGAGNYGGMDGMAETAYADFHIDLPPPNEERLYQRVYSDQDNTQEIFSVRGLDGDTRACGCRADMPKGNVVIVIGQSIPFWDQTSDATKAFGDYVIGTEFGEPKQ